MTKTLKHRTETSKQTKTRNYIVINSIKTLKMVHIKKIKKNKIGIQNVYVKTSKLQIDEVKRNNAIEM